MNIRHGGCIYTVQHPPQLPTKHLCKPYANFTGCKVALPACSFVEIGSTDGYPKQNWSWKWCFLPGYKQTGFRFKYNNKLEDALQDIVHTLPRSRYHLLKLFVMNILVWSAVKRYPARPYASFHPKMSLLKMQWVLPDHCILDIRLRYELCWFAVPCSFINFSYRTATGARISLYAGHQPGLTWCVLFLNKVR